MPDFPHLPLPVKIPATHKAPKFRIEREISPQTLDHLENRQQHAANLLHAADALIQDWKDNLSKLEEQELPSLPDPGVVPVFLQIDANEFTADQLYSFGIDVISEEEDGFVIGTSGDEFKSLKNKVDAFLQSRGKFRNKAAQLWNIVLGKQWRYDYILSPELLAKWNAIEEDEVFIVDVSIACGIKIPQPPQRQKNETEKRYWNRYNDWAERKRKQEEERMDLEMKRQDEFDIFCRDLYAERLGSFVNNDDSFSCRLRISGKALGHLVSTYQYLFDVTEYDQLTFIAPGTGEELLIEAEIEGPDSAAVKVCVIDSGIQEGHRLLQDAILSGDSRCYLNGDSSVADEVSGGGHGTKVAGAVLFGNHIPHAGTHKHTIWIQNARVLNKDRAMPHALYPPALMEEIATDFQDTMVFNLSVNVRHPCRTVHMSQWAATIDKISHDQNKLFVVSAGNVFDQNALPTNPGIVEHLAAARNYPDYLLENSCRIANPAQSCFALSVGSVGKTKFEDDDRESFADKDEISAFSRTGPGLWKMIKPDVVEYGGDFIREKNAMPFLTSLPLTSAEVVQITTDGDKAIGYDNGTSYAAPKVAHIAASVLNEMPKASNNLVRALVVQSARLPETEFRHPNLDALRKYGYGIPLKERATENNLQRITLTAESKIAAKQAEIFTIKIPREIRGVPDEFDLLIQVTIAFTAKVRRTRRRTQSYLSTWLDWRSSKFEENYNQFKARVSHYTDGDEVEDADEGAQSIPWCIRENAGWGTVKGIRRQDSSVQKDWVILKPYQMPEEFSLAVVGHKGWENDITEQVPYAIAVSFEVLNAEIDVYNSIRIENEIEIEQRIIV